MRTYRTHHPSSYQRSATQRGPRKISKTRSNLERSLVSTLAVVGLICGGCSPQEDKSISPGASTTNQASDSTQDQQGSTSLPPNGTKSAPETSKACPDDWTKTETLHGSIHLPAGFQAAVSNGDDSVGFRASGNLQGPVQLFFEEGPGVPQEPRQLPVPYPEELDQLPMRRVIFRCGQTKQQAGILYYNDRLEGSKTYAEGIFFEGTTNVVERFRLTFPPSALEQISDILSTIESP